ncbi:MAG: hypothetical protein K2X93_25365 [Candidatus Obscuribacterales bacterium]|nr:hypothetical protein [Candidatus Obscuribacterales bacterium]
MFVLLQWRKGEHIATRQAIDQRIPWLQVRPSQPSTSRPRVSGPQKPSSLTGKTHHPALKNEPNFPAILRDVLKRLDQMKVDNAEEPQVLNNYHRPSRWAASS